MQNFNTSTNNILFQGLNEPSHSMWYTLKAIQFEGIQLFRRNSLTQVRDLLVLVIEGKNQQITSLFFIIVSEFAKDKLG